MSETADSYTRVAGEYAHRIFNELADKPLDRALLTRLAMETLGKGPLCDMGCGPGQVARFLKDLGADALGVDLAPGMVAEAARLSPDIPFFVGDMLRLEFPANAWSGIAAFYSLIHIPRARIEAALTEFRRVLQPGGYLLLAFHVGDQTVHLDQWWDQPVSLDFNFLQPAEMEQALRRSGFERIETILREPYPEVEHQSQRAYIFACRPIGA